MDHSKHVRLTSAELTADTLKGVTTYGVDDSKVGTVSHLDGAGSNSLVVVDVGGFLGAKPVAVPIGNLEFMRDEDGDVHAITGWTKDQLKEIPEHKD